MSDKVADELASTLGVTNLCMVGSGMLLGGSMAFSWDRCCAVMLASAVALFVIGAALQVRAIKAIEKGES